MSGIEKRENANYFLANLPVETKYFVKQNFCKLNSGLKGIFKAIFEQSTLGFFKRFSSFSKALP